MNKLLLLLAAATISSSSFSQKHQATTQSHIIKLGVNTFFDADEFPFSISWEKKVARNQSIQIGFLPRFRTEGSNKTNGISFNVGFRNYISKNRTGIGGLFISPIAKIGFLKDEYPSYYYNPGTNPPTYTNYKSSSKITQFSGGILFGQNWVYKSGFSFEVSGGIGYYGSTDKNSQTNISPNTTNTYKQSGIMPQLQLSIGYAF